MNTIYEILRRPLVTEKTSSQSGKANQYSFVVADDAKSDRSHVVL